MSDGPNERALYPSVRAFVVLLRGDCDPAENDVRGKIEHVRSGTSLRFDSVEELVAFLVRLTTSDGARP